MTALASTSLPVIAKLPVVSAGNPAVRQQPTAKPPGDADEGAFQRVLCPALGAPNVELARDQLLRALIDWFGAKGAAIGWQRPGGRRWRLAASGEYRPDGRSEYGRALNAAFAETSLRATTLRWPDGSDPSCSTPPTYRQLAALVGAAQIMGIPLRSSDHEQPGVLLLWGNAFCEPSFSELSALAGLIRLLDAATPSKLEHLARWCATVAQRRWLVLPLAVAMALVAFIPVPDRVHCHCTLEPQVRRFVVAPFDGTLEKSLVQTGDYVTSGQSLALLDQRPLQMELTVLQGHADEARKREGAARAKGQAGLAQMAELEAAQTTAKIAHLHHQLEQLNVVSPITGIVVRGELKRVEGAPLTRGQSLFEVAPLSTLVAELAVPEDEVRLVQPGMPVTVRPAALPGRSLSGQIDRVHPRAEIRDRQTVFIAEVTLDNKQTLLMPGMEAQATIRSHAQPLGWTVVRRPVIRIARAGWGGNMASTPSAAAPLANLRPKLRGDLRITADVQEGFILEDPVRGQFFRLGSAEYRVVAQLNGQTTLPEAAQQTGSGNAPSLTLERLDGLARFLLTTGLVESHAPATTSAPPAATPSGPAKFNPLYIRLPLGPPGRILVHLERAWGWLFSTPALILVSLLSIAAGLDIAQNWQAFTESLSGVLCPDQHLTLFVCWLGLKLVHELGHAIACRRLGGEVRDWGLAFIFFMPVPYGDATSSWRFTSRWDRMAVAAAGMYVEWLIALIAVAVWSTTTSPALRHVCVYIVSLATLTTILFNANPLCRLDGYYLLSDLLQWPNLSAQGQTAARACLQRLLWGDAPAPHNIPPRRYWFALTYGIASGIWRFLSLLAMAIVVVLAYEGFGLLLIAAIALMLIWQSRHRLGQQGPSRIWRTDRVARLITRVAIGTAAIFVLGWWVPWPGAISVPGIVENVERHLVRARTAGHVAALHVQNGQHVSAGQTLAVLKNDDLELELTNLELAYELGEAKERSLLTKRDLVELQVHQRRQQTLREQIEELQRKHSGLTLNSPVDGFIVARRLSDLEGAYLADGAELCLVVERGFEFRLSIAQRDLPYFTDRVGQPLKIRIAGQSIPGQFARLEPNASIALLDPALGANAGGPLAVVPANSQAGGDESTADQWKLTEPRVLAHVSLPDLDQDLLFAGQRGRATIASPEFTLASRLRRLAADWHARLQRRSDAN